ncbi:hypothetical protein CABS01_00430 [Colletotrichum abscissum]|uniref:uncharacterized protein n=1 Tax=Colletotrichum abscissum TaxID=1671311 RepID=UPI0027D6AC9A|nr:uncharacterized protein CABS01_00430 [Colletotrichum abscissum]KAK1525341.1 hypothetical protein CABS01_00430 [Colletotrichum abscissum]
MRNWWCRVVLSLSVSIGYPRGGAEKGTMDATPLIPRHLGRLQVCVKEAGKAVDFGALLLCVSHLLRHRRIASLEPLWERTSPSPIVGFAAGVTSPFLRLRRLNSRLGRLTRQTQAQKPGSFAANAAEPV